MEFPKVEIGRRIRMMRRELGITSEELAKRAGVSQSMVSQIERGLVSPSLETLWNLANSLNVQIFAFFDQTDGERVNVYKKDDELVVKRIRPNSEYHLLSPSIGKDIGFFKLVVDPGDTVEDQVIQHKGEECGYVLEGTLIVEVGPERYELVEGDAIFFDSELPHRFFNPGNKPAIAIWAMTANWR